MPYDRGEIQVPVRKRTLPLYGKLSCEGNLALTNPEPNVAIAIANQEHGEGGNHVFWGPDAYTGPFVRLYSRCGGIVSMLTCVLCFTLVCVYCAFM